MTVALWFVVYFGGCLALGLAIAVIGNLPPTEERE